MMKDVQLVRQVWRSMWRDVGMPCMPVNEDDESAVQLAIIPITKSNSKHIDVRHHFFRELAGTSCIGDPRAVRFSTCGFVDLS